MATLINDIETDDKRVHAELLVLVQAIAATRKKEWIDRAV